LPVDRSELFESGKVMNSATEQSDLIRIVSNPSEVSSFTSKQLKIDNVGTALTQDQK